MKAIDPLSKEYNEDLAEKLNLKWAEMKIPNKAYAYQINPRRNDSYWGVSSDAVVKFA